MPLLTPSDWAEMAEDLAQVREDNEISIIIRRGNTTTLLPQKVRIAGGRSAGGFTQGRAVQQSTGSITILGGTDLDIRVQDRFTNVGILYEVDFVRPNRRVAIMASAKMVL